eukprot:CAMPEP_0174268506 /NCGR_PEP_ID=MMETSP0439-20130205/37698_1 /TAXON_ID=0 /ORGANISM="Stereomyxa ramosa, Strain Chinc5" /LENGTH=101 /DNA_ID=CAMNT_0015356715 /DNA_START=188 /DNA_END=490 /DNA_ORIENTATION=+
MTTVSVLNNCEYCRDFHAVASGLSGEEVKTLKAGDSIASHRSLIQATRALFENHGRCNEVQFAEKYELSVSKVHEICYMIGLLTSANYINHLDMPKNEDWM